MRVRIIAAFSIACILVLLNGYISLSAIISLSENNSRVVDSFEVIQSADAVLVALIDAETGQRGFIITGEDRYLEPYYLGLRNLDESFARMSNLSAGEPAQAERIAALEKVARSRMSILAANIERFRQSGRAGAASTELLDPGKREMDAARTLIAEFLADERLRLEARTQNSVRSGKSAAFTVVAANLFALALLGVIYFLVPRYLAERKRAEHALRASNEFLEQRVKERTSELDESNQELERSNRELQDFAFVASHDLQEPLRKIQAFGDRLVTKHGPELSEQGRDYLGRMQSAAGRMHTLINDLLTFSRVTTKAQPFEPCDLDQIATEVLNDLEVRLQDNNAHLEIDTLPTIDADPLQMRQLLQNLIGNAIKFHRPGVPPIIKIKGTLAEGPDGRETLTLTVADNGIGFDEKYLDRIFTPFQRLHGRDAYEGTGIGLAVCRKIVERHGGTLTAESTPGKGSTFVATLPAKHDVEEA